MHLRATAERRWASAQVLSSDGGETWDTANTVILREDGGTPTQSMAITDPPDLESLRLSGAGVFGSESRLRLIRGRYPSENARPDLGYAISTQLDDGTILSVYYITLEDGITHCACTRWEAERKGGASMIRMSPPLGDLLRPGDEGAEGRALLTKRAAVMNVDTVSIKAFSRLERRRDPRGPRDGWMTTAFGSERSLPSGTDGTSAFTIPPSTRSLSPSYSEQVRIAAKIGARCVGFGWGKEFGWPSPDNLVGGDVGRRASLRSRNCRKWQSGEGMDIAAHPLYFTPLKSVETLQKT